MKQKWIAPILALALTASLAACGGQPAVSAAPDASPPPQADASLPAESAPEDTPEEAPEEADPAGSETQDGAAPAGKPEEPPAQNGGGKPQEETKPAGAASSEPTGVKSVDLAAFYETISGGDFPAMTALEGDALDALYEGLSDLKPKQCLVYTPMISAVGAEIALVEASSGGDVQKIKDIFQSRIDYQLEQGAFYPQTVEAWENSARIVSNGNYILLACMGDGGCDTIVDQFNALF